MMSDLEEHALTRTKAMQLRGYSPEEINGNGHTPPTKAQVDQTTSDPSPAPSEPEKGARRAQRRSCDVCGKIMTSGRSRWCSPSCKAKARRAAAQSRPSTAGVVEVVEALAGAGLVVGLVVEGIELTVRSPAEG